MGNSLTSVSISCDVEQASYKAGDIIHGTAHVTVNGSRPISSFDGITVTLAGVEYAPSASASASKSTLSHVGRRFKVEKQIAQVDVLEPGTHSFEFTIQLPKSKKSNIINTPPRTIDTRKTTHYRTMSAMSDASGHGSPFAMDATAADDTSNESMSVSSRVGYKLRAQLRRRANVPKTIDTDIWADAKTATGAVVAAQ